MKRYEDFGGMVISLIHTAEIPDSKHGSVIVHNIFAYFELSLSAAQVYVIQERCWFSQIDFFVKYFPHRIKNFASFQPIFMSSTYTDKNNPFSR